MQNSSVISDASLLAGTVANNSIQSLPISVPKTNSGPNLAHFKSGGGKSGLFDEDEHMKAVASNLANIVDEEENKSTIQHSNVPQPAKGWYYQDPQMEIQGNHYT